MAEIKLDHIHKVYDETEDNVFITSFIGSPIMNLHEVHCHNGRF